MPDFSLVGILAQFGITGAAIALAITTVLWLYKSLQESWNERLKDLKELQTVITAQTTALQAAARAQEESVRAAEKMAHAQEMLGRTVETAHLQNSQKLENMARELTQLNARESWRRDSQ